MTGPDVLLPPPARRTVIEPPAGWQPVDGRELWRFRELLAFLVWRDVKVRYKQTALGAGWAVLQPAMMMGVFTVFFGRLAGLSSGDVPYPLYTLAGLVVWMFFAAAVTSAANSVLGSERLISKIYFPRLLVPLAAVAAAAVDFLVATGLVAVVAFGCWLAGYPVAPNAQVLLLPVVALIVAGLAAGLGTLLAALNVTYRDFRYVVPFFIQLGMFATPTIYMRPTGEETGWLGLVLAVNPMTGLVSGFRAAVLGGPVPWAGLAAGAVVAVALLTVGALYFRKAEDRFADVI